MTTTIFPFILYSLRVVYDCIWGNCKVATFQIEKFEKSTFKISKTLQHSNTCLKPANSLKKMLESCQKVGSWLSNTPLSLSVTAFETTFFAYLVIFLNKNIDTLEPSAFEPKNCQKWYLCLLTSCNDFVINLIKVHYKCYGKWQNCA